MDFVRKNWAKMAISLVALVGVVLTTILLFTGPLKDAATYGAFADDMQMSGLYSLIAQILFFVALAAYPILRMFDQTRTVAGYVLLGLAVLAALFAILSITSAMDFVNDASDKIQAGYDLANPLAAGTQVPGQAAGVTREIFLAGLDVKKWTLTSGTYTKFVNLIVFAALPLVYGLKKVLKKEQA